MAQQIPFSFGRFDSFGFDSYLPGQNEQITTYLKRLLTGAEVKNLYLWGAAGTGKSHLLQAVCTSAAALGSKPAYIPLSEINKFAPQMLEGLEQLDLVCIDALEHIAGKENWEVAVFHLFNRLREQQRPFIMTALNSPQGLPVSLPDLKSRLSWDVVYQLQALTEEQRVEVLRQRAKSRGFELPDDVIAYLIKRVCRDMHSLLDWLDKLDDASLAAKKKLTVPFVKQLLSQS